jgi:addiction module RelE/StbE family toxin
MEDHMDAEYVPVTQGLAELESGQVEHFPMFLMTAAWWAFVTGRISWPPETEILEPEEGCYYHADASPPAPTQPPPWMIGMSRTFAKEVLRLDKVLQGRILEAITELAEGKVAVLGDTNKPLRGQLDGCWRYRIGDYRLVYRPDKKLGNLTLLAIAPRGGVYD